MTSEMRLDSSLEEGETIEKKLSQRIRKMRMRWTNCERKRRKAKEPQKDFICTTKVNTR